MVGLAVLFLIAALAGTARREHFTKESAQWDSIRTGVEEQLKKNLDFDIAAFRKAIAEQNKFFEVEQETLDNTGRALGIPLGAPDMTQVTKVNSLFDEKIRILTEEMEAEQKKGTQVGFVSANTSGLGIAILKTLARNYMIGMVEGKPKGTLNLFSS